MDFDSTIFPLRPAWVEIDLARLRNNLRLIRRDLPRHVQLLAVVKDEAYGHGALDVARIAAIQKLKPGEAVGYGMRYTAASERRIVVLPIGYGDGCPRVYNQGGALIRGQYAPLIGGIAMDALLVDITDIPEARMWDEAVLMGRQGNEEITVHGIAKLKNSVSYDVLTNWRLRLRRKAVNAKPQIERNLEQLATHEK